MTGDGRGGRLHADAERVAGRYLAALGAMDEEALVSVFSPDAVAVLPAGSVPARGTAEIRGLIRSIFAAVEPVEVRREFLVGAEGSVAVKWQGRWRALSGEVTFGGIDVFEVDGGGRITAWHAYWDRSAFLAGS